MRLLALVLTTLLVVIQWPLWFGKGGWMRVWDLDRQLVAQRTVNGVYNSRNADWGRGRDMREGREPSEVRGTS